jgi:8-oxo-dGTP pyrophosphatase MutT (NUDIX family)
MEDETFYIGQKAFVNRNGKVLTLDDPEIGIDFPGGKIQVGETDFSKSLKREVREETGLEITVGRPFVTWEIQMFNHYKGNRLFLVGYACSYVSGEVKISSEHTGFKWVSKSTYKKIESNTEHFKALSKYFKGT